MNSKGLTGGRATDDRRAKRQLLVLALLFGAVAVLAGVDLASDMGEGASVAHWALEGGIFLIGLLGFGFMLRGWLRYAEQTETLKSETINLANQLAERDDAAQALSAALRAKEEEAARWRDETRALLDGLGVAIDRQFDRWRLTDAEKEVALLLLKGLSHKEIAGVRGTSEATNRQQARAVYKKGGLTGRNDLAAFFLEDLLLPMREG